ncbi:hypothetical protein HPB47_012660 [Ixodes persulcatus]|uniref:Uncharacterized protein n=1 Tax=Ixodes persulcatus TaxID=34615 RepID=A0AC60NSY8_IXOPE|nr:hypothetical protein HPB47_012660 [Ixodes persulcatus]
MDKKEDRVKKRSHARSRTSIPPALKPMLKALCVGYLHNSWNNHMLGRKLGDAKYHGQSWFLYVEIGHHSSESDGGIFARSQLQQRINCGEQGLPPPAAVGEEGDLPYFLLGDEAFSLKAYFIRPYPRKSKEAYRVRAKLTHHFVNEGAVPWQDNMVMKPGEN